MKKMIRVIDLIHISILKRLVESAEYDYTYSINDAPKKMRVRGYRYWFINSVEFYVRGDGFYVTERMKKNLEKNIEKL